MDEGTISFDNIPKDRRSMDKRQNVTLTLHDKKFEASSSLFLKLRLRPSLRTNTQTVRSEKIVLNRNNKTLF